MTGTVRFTFEGEEIATPEGRSLAAALTEAGHRTFRHTDGGGTRGIFCGMGVCQDCLVTVDGAPNRRACMTQAAEGMAVTRQAARPPLSAPAGTTPKAERLEPDILIVGGGAAGLNAGIAAREAGADVLLIDERKVAGGQYFKQAAGGAAPLDAQQADGADLVARARTAGVEMLSGVEVWGAFDGPQVLASAPGRSLAIRPRALIVATGAYERPLMIPGWTLPGVMTVGAAQTLWRSYRVPAGRRVAVFGNGPLNPQVALELAEGGAEIVLLGEAAPPGWTRPGAGLAMARHDRRLTAKGAGMLLSLKRRGVPLAWNTLPLEIAEAEGALSVRYRTGTTERQVTVDAVCMNFGFQPQNEILRLLGADMTYDARFAQLRPERSEVMETTIPGVFAVGDCCGLGGAPAAAVEGRIAGRAAAGGGGPSPAERAELAHHRGFQDALWTLYATDLPQLEGATPETLVCRCEEVARAKLDAALEGGAEDIGAVKRATRIGMGRCQGRYCGPVLAGYLSRAQGRPLEDLSYFAPRVPIKPVDIATVVAAEPLFRDAAGDG